MQTDFIDQIEPTPKLFTKKCKFIAFLLRICLQFTSYIVGLVSWYYSDYFMGIALFLLSFIIIGIIRSKLMHSVIPASQHEYNYNAQDIADWYTARSICI